VHDDWVLDIGQKKRQHNHGDYFATRRQSDYDYYPAVKNILAFSNHPLFVKTRGGLRFLQIKIAYNGGLDRLFLQ
jgi:hypothetical protein